LRKRNQPNKQFPKSKLSS